MAESEAIRKRLRMNKEVGKILTPRFVFTDKHSGLRAADRPLPLEAQQEWRFWGSEMCFLLQFAKMPPLVLV